MVDFSELVKTQKGNRVKWGFIWAILCALLWGLGYVPLQIVWGVDPIVNLDLKYPELGGDAAYMVASILVAAFMAFIFALVILLFWSLLTGKMKETFRTVKCVKISKWIAIGAAFGGPVAVVGTSLAIAYIGAAFASSITLLSAVVGTITARILFKEKLTRNSIAGLILLVVGGIVILDPTAMINDLSGGGEGVIFGYIGGAMAAIGFGLEGVFAATAMDVTDADSSTAVKYITESLMWIIILLPATAIAIGPGLFGDILIDVLTSGSFIFWMVICAFSLGMCYVTMYKCYPLLGVGRTQAITALYVPVSIVALWAFLGAEPTLWIAGGTVVSLIGLFVMVRDSSNIADSTRGSNDSNKGGV